MRNGRIGHGSFRGDFAPFRVIDGGNVGPQVAAVPGATRTDDDDDLRPALIAAAREEVRRRTDRRLVLGPDLLAEPVWDMLLDLYLSEETRRHIAVSSLCTASGVPTTTALRYIRIMEQEGLLLRERDRADARRSFVRLSMAAREKVELLLRRAVDRGA